MKCTRTITNRNRLRLSRKLNLKERFGNLLHLNLIYRAWGLQYVQSTLSVMDWFFCYSQMGKDFETQSATLQSLRNYIGELSPEKGEKDQLTETIQVRSWDTYGPRLCLTNLIAASSRRKCLYIFPVFSMSKKKKNL